MDRTPELKATDLERRVRGAGLFSQLAGWFLVVIVLPAFFISGFFDLHDGFAEKFIQPRLWLALVLTAIGVVLVILGRRIATARDQHTEWYLQVLIAAFGASVIYIPFAIYFLSILNSWQKLSKTKEFESQEKITEHKIRKPLWIGGGVILVLLIMASFFREPFSDSLYKKYFRKGPDFADVAAVVVNVFCPSADQPFSPESNGPAGSGTLLGNGLVLTNSHIFDQNETKIFHEGCFVFLYSDSSVAYVAEPRVYQGLSDEYDLAFLEIYGVYGDNGDIIPMSEEYLASLPSYFDIFDEVRACQEYVAEIPDRIYVLGYPGSTGGFSLTATDGIISAFREDGQIYTSAIIDSGNSGGLAVNEDYCIVGVPSAVSLMGDHSRPGIIIPNDWILGFIDQIPASPQCFDDIDNDADGLTDMDDPGCDDNEDDDELDLQVGAFEFESTDELDVQ